MKTHAEYAEAYVRHGLVLTPPIPPGEKYPKGVDGWNTPSRYVTDPTVARKLWTAKPDHGMGVLHRPSGTCAFDVDHVEHTKAVFTELGVDFESLFTGAPRWRGNPERDKALWRVPEGVDLDLQKLTWPEKPEEMAAWDAAMAEWKANGQEGDQPRRPKPTTVFELRAGDNQDVLPPTIYPGTNKPYSVVQPLNGAIPEPPAPLLDLWRHWDEVEPMLKAMCPWAPLEPPPSPKRETTGGRGDVIGAYNRAHPVAELLETHGYIQKGGPGRYLSPTSSSGLPGVRILDSGRVYSDHASDPLAQPGDDGRQHAHDAFSLFTVLDHNGDVRAAVKAAAQELNIPFEARPHPGDGPSFPELVAMIEAEDDFEELVVRIAETVTRSGLPHCHKHTLRKLVAKKANTTVKALIEDAHPLEVELGLEVDKRLTHLEAARETINALGEKNVVFAYGRVWGWRGDGVWRPEDDRAIKAQIHDLAETNEVQLTRSVVDSVFDLFCTEVALPGHQFDQEQETINCLNGELRYEALVGGWVLEPHVREHYRTTQIPVAYDPDAKAERFKRFLHEIFKGDPEREKKALLLCEAIGYSLLTTARFERFLILIGLGANGKSVVLAVLEALLGRDNVAAVQPSQLGNKFQRAHLHGKLANLVTEIAVGEVIADAELKAIVSGEVTTAEHKFLAPFEFRPFATCWFGTNHLPHTRDFSDALFRRAIILPFTQKFEGSRCDVHLKDKLIAELPGVLNLALSAIAGVFERGEFTTCEEVDQIKRDWRIEADQVAQFVEECCELGPQDRARSAAVFDEYLSWAGRSGIRLTVGRRNFIDRLKRHGVDTGKGTAGVRMLKGIRLKDPSSEWR